MVALKAIHNAISEQGIPIASVRKLENGDLEIDFSPSATAEQQAEAQAILINWSDPIESTWDGFVDGIEVTIMAAIAASPMAALIVARITRLADRGDRWQGEGDRLISAWNAAPPLLDAAQRETLNTLATTNHLPIRLEENNLLIVV